MPNLDLPADWLGMVVELLTEHVPQSEVWAYGSRVTGGNHEGSDLDLVIRDPGNLSSPQPGLGGLRSAFSESKVPILVELHDWALLPVAFQSEIERAHVTLPLHRRTSGAHNTT